MKKFLAAIALLASITFGQTRIPATPENYKPPKPYVQTVNEHVDTLVVGMAQPTAQLTFDSFMGLALQSFESSFIVPGVARGERTVFQEAESLKAWGGGYCALHVNLTPCNDGTLEIASKKWADKYVEWTATQPVGVYVQGGPWDVSIAGNRITVEAPPPPPRLAVVGECFPSWPPGTRLCQAPGALSAGMKDGDVVTQDGKKYRINVNRGFAGMIQANATPIE